MIIDCLLNLPLLYWATEATGDEKYADIARRHIDTSLKVVLREDHSTYHTYYFEKAQENLSMVRRAKDIVMIRHGQEDKLGESMEQH